MNQDKVKKPVGVWRSIIYERDDKTGEVKKTVTPWTKNLIVDRCYILQAALFENSATLTSGLQYMAFGNGDSGWDPTPPSPSVSDTTLYSEVFRYQLQSSDFDYLDASLVVVPGPTQRLQITGILDYGDANGDYIREFGLFGGNATGVADSGYLVNVIRTERFFKTPAIRLERQVILGMGLA